MEIRSNEIVSVIIVTVGAGDHLRRCLHSLSLQTYSCLDSIVVDNSLQSSWSRGLALSFPAAKFYSSPFRMAYGESLNKGISLSAGAYILCLNDDVVLEASFIQEALRGFSAGPRVGMVSGKILRWDRKTLDSTGLFLSYCRTARERGYGTRDRGQFEQQGFVFGASGAAALYKREMLEDIKQGADYFDSRFRFFYEDLDLAWRGQRAGWLGYYVPSALAYHLRGASLRTPQGISRPLARRFLSEECYLELVKNRYLTILKNETAPRFIWHLPGILFYDLFAWIYLLVFKPKLIKKIPRLVSQIQLSLKKNNLSRS